MELGNLLGMPGSVSRGNLYTSNILVAHIKFNSVCACGCVIQLLL